MHCVGVLCSDEKGGFFLGKKKHTEFETRVQKTIPYVRPKWPQYIFLRRGDTYIPVPLPLGKNKRLSHELRFNWNFIVSLFLGLTSSLIKRFSRGSNRYPGFCQVASTDRCYPFIHLGEERPCESELSYPNNTTQWEQTGRLPHMTKCVVQYAADWGKT